MPKKIENLLELWRVIQAYEDLSYGAKLHFGWMCRSRGMMSLQVLIDEHANEPNVLELLQLLRNSGFDLEKDR